MSVLNQTAQEAAKAARNRKTTPAAEEPPAPMQEGGMSHAEHMAQMKALLPPGAVLDEYTHTYHMGEGWYAQNYKELDGKMALDGDPIEIEAEQEDSAAPEAVPAAVAMELGVNAVDVPTIVTAIKGLKAEAAEQRIEARGGMDVLKAEVARLTDQVSGFEASYADRIKDIETLESTVTALKAECDALRVQVAAADQQIARAELKAAGAAADQIDDLVDVVTGPKYRPEGTTIADAVAAHKEKVPSAYGAASPNRVDPAGGDKPTDGKGQGEHAVQVPGYKGGIKIEARRPLPEAALDRQEPAQDSDDDRPKTPGFGRAR